MRTALAFRDAVCPSCRLTVLTPFTVATWRGQAVCYVCKSDLDSHDAEDARRNIRDLTTVTLRLAAREP